MGSGAALVGSQINFHGFSRAKTTEPLIAVISAYPPETEALSRIFLGNRPPVATVTLNGTSADKITLFIMRVYPLYK